MRVNVGCAMSVAIYRAGSWYQDFGQPYRRWKGSSSVLSDDYAQRPFCDLCGPFRGRYLRLRSGQTWCCLGCDQETP